MAQQNQASKLNQSIFGPAKGNNTSYMQHQQFAGMGALEMSQDQTQQQTFMMAAPDSPSNNMQQQVGQFPDDNSEFLQQIQQQQQYSSRG